MGIKFLAGMPRLPVARKTRGLQGLAGVWRRALSHCLAQQPGHTLLLWRSALLPKSLALFPAPGMGLTSRTQPVPKPMHHTRAGPAGATLACAPAPHPPPAPGPTCTAHSGVLCAAGRKLSLQPLLPPSEGQPRCSVSRASGCCGGMRATFPKPHTQVPQGRGRTLPS